VLGTKIRPPVRLHSPEIVSGFTFPGVVSDPTLNTKLLTCAAVVRSGAHAAWCSELIQPWKYESSGVDITQASVRREARFPEPGRIVALVYQVPSKSFALHCCSDEVPTHVIPQLLVARATMAPDCGVWCARTAVAGSTVAASSKTRTRAGRMARIVRTVSAWRQESARSFVARTQRRKQSRIARDKAGSCSCTNPASSVNQ
jgi:hypothetical protein